MKQENKYNDTNAVEMASLHKNKTNRNKEKVTKDRSIEMYINKYKRVQKVSGNNEEQIDKIGATRHA